MVKKRKEEEQLPVKEDSVEEKQSLANAPTLSTVEDDKGTKQLDTPTE